MRAVVDSAGFDLMVEDAVVASTVERMAGVVVPAVIRMTEPVEVGREGGAMAICVVGFAATSADAVGGEDSPTIRSVLLPGLEAMGTNPGVSGGSPRLAPKLMRVGAVGRAGGLVALATASGRAFGCGGATDRGALADWV